MCIFDEFANLHCIHSLKLAKETCLCCELADHPMLILQSQGVKIGEIKTNHRKESCGRLFPLRKNNNVKPTYTYLPTVWIMLCHHRVYYVFYFQQKTKPLMTEFSVKSTIISRYAFTTVSCKMLNRASNDQEIEFQMQIPAAAFITNFTM